MLLTSDGTSTVGVCGVGRLAEGRITVGAGAADGDGVTAGLGLLGAAFGLLRPGRLFVALAVGDGSAVGVVVGAVVGAGAGPGVGVVPVIVKVTVLSAAFQCELPDHSTLTLQLPMLVKVRVRLEIEQFALFGSSLNETNE